MKRQKYIIDTTLRDGEQSPGFAFSSRTKAQIAHSLDQLGIYQIEAGIPAMGRQEKESILRIMGNRKNSRISVWNRIKISDIKHSIDCRPDVIHISAPVSYVQIYSKLKKNKVWLISTLLRCVDYAKSKGYEVTVGLEDASRADISFISSITKILHDYEVKFVRYADTVGILTPSQTESVVKDIMESSELSIEMHAHNDIGMAVANSIAASKAGADYIDCTLWGIGERAGNCNLTKFINAAQHNYDLGFSFFDAECVEEQLKEIVSGGAL